MSENIHNDDEFYRKAYNNFEEEPSPEVWEKLNARLDHQDAATYHAKFISWKRIAVVLFFLLGSAAAYKIFFKPGTGTASSNASAEKEHAASVQGSALHPSPSNHYQPQNSTNDSLNKANATVPFNSKQNNKQEAQQTANNASAVLGNHPATSHSITNNTTKRNEIAEENSFKSKKNQQPDAHENASADAMQHDKKNALDESLNHPDTIATISNKADEETVLSQSDKVNKSTEDTLSNSAVNDSALAVSKSIATGTNISTANNKKSPIKIKKVSLPHFSISPYIAADFTGLQIDNDEHSVDPDRRNERRDIEELEDNQFSYSAGVLARYQFSQRVSLKSGIVYLNTAIHTKPETWYAMRDNDRGTGYKYVSSLGYAYVKPSFDESPAVGDSVHSEDAEQHASYLSIPLMAGYTFHAGKQFTIVPGIGFTTNFLLDSKAQTEVHKNNVQSNITITNMQGLAPVYFSFVTDVELHYQLTHNFSLMLLPSFRHAIVPTTFNHVVKTYPYSFGLGIGISYGL